MRKEVNEKRTNDAGNIRNLKKKSLFHITGIFKEKQEDISIK